MQRQLMLQQSSDTERAQHLLAAQSQTKRWAVIVPQLQNCNGRLVRDVAVSVHHAVSRAKAFVFRLRTVQTGLTMTLDLYQGCHYAADFTTTCSRSQDTGLLAFSADQADTMFSLSEEFEQAQSRSARLLGKGGCCTNVERCFHKVTQQAYAVKKFDREFMMKRGDFCKNETNALKRADEQSVPRVPKFVTALKDELAGSKAIVMELISGWDLYTWRRFHVPDFGLDGNELHMQSIAVQLLETLSHLHLKARTAHLDISSRNIIYNPDADYFDEIRLLDFGLSQKCTHTKAEVAAYMAQNGLVKYDWCNVTPLGSTLTYASPELLRALQLQLEGQADHEEVWMNGPAADNWSTGAVLFEMLTGKLPFCPEASAQLPQAPDTVLPKNRKRWQQYEAFLQLHQEWEDAVAKVSGRPDKIVHPLLEMVRKHSKTPEYAAAFFLKLMWPCQSQRSGCELLTHPYLQDLNPIMVQCTGRPVLVDYLDQSPPQPWQMNHCIASWSVGSKSPASSSTPSTSPSRVLLPNVAAAKSPSTTPLKSFPVLASNTNSASSSSLLVPDEAIAMSPPTPLLQSHPVLVSNTPSSSASPFSVPDGTVAKPSATPPLQSFPILVSDVPLTSSSLLLAPEKAGSRSPSTPPQSFPIDASETLTTCSTQSSTAVMALSSSGKAENSPEDQTIDSAYASASHQAKSVSVATAEAEEAAESTPYMLEDSREPAESTGLWGWAKKAFKHACNTAGVVVKSCLQLTRWF